MTGLVNKLVVSLTVEIPHDALESQSPMSAVVIAEQVTEQVMDYEREHRLGYYPALDYYQREGALDNDLINALQGISWLSCSMAQEEVKTRLRPVFSTIKFESVQSPVNSLPSARPGGNNVQQKLIEHYTADKVKLTFTASMIRKAEDDQTTEDYARNVIGKWLKDRFASFKINSIKKVD